VAVHVGKALESFSDCRLSGNRVLDLGDVPLDFSYTVPQIGSLLAEVFNQLTDDLLRRAVRIIIPVKN